MTNYQVAKKQTILVTGVTGYIGGRLIPYLLEAGYNVRVIVRGNKDRLVDRSWFSQIEVVVADALKPETLPAAMQGIDAAYYLIHSMRGNSRFHERDQTAARNFGTAAHEANVERIIYLGGLGKESDELSEHLQSRQETGEYLRESGVPVTEFRAAIVVGSGSVSFEMIRHLTERVPIMICPKWVFTKIQPIAIFDLLDYLVAALKTPESADRIIEIGGANVITYGDMMLGYAAERKLARRLVPVPLLTPYLSSLWVHLVTPIPSKIARPLIKGLRNEVIVTNDDARRIFPNIKPADYEGALKRALRRIRSGDLETVWSDAISSTLGDRAPYTLAAEQGMYIDYHERQISADVDRVYHAFTTLGGQNGWPPYTWLWRIRGIMDRMVGGIGLRRGRRDPVTLRVGDALDFWRVEDVIEGDRLLLRAEMKLPGRAWLRFVTIPYADGTSQLQQTAFFAPKGLFGFLYWWSVYPLHKIVFPGMLNNIAERAEALPVQGSHGNNDE